MPDPNLEHARTLYVKSLKAMDAEITGLLSFAVDFKGEASTHRLTQAQELIRTEISDSRTSS